MTGQRRPAWLQRLIEEQGAGHTRRARGGACPRCYRPVIRGLDGHCLALPATVDPEELDHLAELLALLAGRATYDVYRIPGVELEFRNPLRIAGARTRPVLADHRCPEGS